ncbi:MAG: hypothetical protein II846_04320 [Acetobacter sp.]|nr:hypothetical protein [Acetobacter sp.]
MNKSFLTAVAAIGIVVMSIDLAHARDLSSSSTPDSAPHAQIGPAERGHMGPKEHASSSSDSSRVQMRSVGGDHMGMMESMWHRHMGMMWHSHHSGYGMCR